MGRDIYDPNYKPELDMCRWRGCRFAKRGGVKGGARGKGPEGRE